MTRYVGYIAMSLDGRIADGNSGLDWLLSYGNPEGGEADYNAFYSSVDALVLGRSTYDYIASHHDWSYAGKTAYVVTSHPLNTDIPDIRAVPPDYAALKARIESAGHQTVWILGGGIVQRSAMDAGLFDHLRVFVMPVVVGSGPLIFADGALRKLRFVGSRVWGGGIVEIAYSFGAAA